MQRRLGLDLEVPDDFGHWLAGFTDGEGRFLANIYLRKTGPYYGERLLHTRYFINLRQDDRAILEQIRIVLGVGKIWVRRNVRPNQNPEVVYCIGPVTDLYHIVIPLFEKYPLRAKKAREFGVWKKIIETRCLEGNQTGPRLQRGRPPLPESYWRKIGPLVEELKEIRRFR